MADTVVTADGKTHTAGPHSRRPNGFYCYICWARGKATQAMPSYSVCGPHADDPRADIAPYEKGN